MTVRGFAMRAPGAITLTLVLSLTLPGASVLAASATTPQPRLPAARLQGFFRLSGRVTVASNVGRERVGQSVSRTWAFLPLCPAGSCYRVVLVRARYRGTDKLVLHRVAPAYYVGTGVFYGPLQCGSRTYPNGEEVPFELSVRITAARRFSTGVLATHVRSSYVNRSRQNLTPCVAFPGHDAAVYRGHLLNPPQTAAANGRPPAER
jgi:hypothetical protein